VGVEHIILGVDRLDYTKGIRERLLAYERFLDKYPEFHGKVCLIQVAVPSRTRVEEYRLLRREIDEAIGRITGRFSKRKWVPLRYLYHAFPIEEIAAYYSASDIALITPLRDGMNLVAKEYVASRIREDGALILSEFTGAAGTLTDATLVNPYDIDGLAEAIRLSLSTPEAEKRSRMQRLRQAVRERDVYWWCESFLKSLAQGKEKIQGGLQTTPL
jgi:trehalose 6-phosphate synthase